MLELRDIYKSFGEVEVLKGISAEIAKGELLTFVGPSGCGKTTLLRIVGGFTTATSGQVILDGEDIGKLPPNMRNTKMVFQSYALFPHMNVRKNIGFGLKLKKWPKEKIDTRVEELLSLVHMEGLGDRTIDRISGGQQQRVALARALALEPKVLLSGRAAFQPGCQPAGGYAGGDQKYPGTDRGYHYICHPRPVRGHEYFRPAPGPERWCDSADRFSNRHLRATCQRVYCRLCGIR